jgi:hypothetical protein
MFLYIQNYELLFNLQYPALGILLWQFKRLEHILRKLIHSFYYSCCFWTQGLMHAGPVLYHWATSTDHQCILMIFYWIRNYSWFLGWHDHFSTKGNRTSKAGSLSPRRQNWSFTKPVRIQLLSTCAASYPVTPFGFGLLEPPVFSICSVTPSRHSPDCPLFLECLPLHLSIRKVLAYTVCFSSSIRISIKANSPDSLDKHCFSYVYIARLSHHFITFLICLSTLLLLLNLCVNTHGEL